MVQLGRITAGQPDLNKIYTKSGQIYCNGAIVKPRDFSADRFATVYDLYNSLNSRSWLSPERKFISWDGDLIQNYSDTNYSINRMTGNYSFNDMSESLGVKLKPYRTTENMNMCELNIDTSIYCVDLLGSFSNEGEICTIIFPGDEITTFDLSNISRKLMIPGISCYINQIVIGYSDGIDIREVSSLEQNPDGFAVNISKLTGVKLFGCEIGSDGSCKKIYNTSISSVNTFGIILDITEDGWLTLYSNSSNVKDCIIKKCDVQFRLNITGL